MNEPLVSIIVPVYNVEDYLRRCLDSVLAQTYKNLEIILVNDGATDGSRAICEKYVAADKRFTLIDQENKGLSGARNTGLDAMSADYLMFLDSDDYIAPTMVEELYRALIDYDADIAACHLQYIGEDELFVPSGTGEATVFQGEELQHILDNTGAWTMVQWNKLFKRKIFDKLRFPLGKYHEDEFVIHREIAAANCFVLINRCLYAYVQRKSSIMGNNDIKKMLDASEGFIDRVEFFDSIGWEHARNGAYFTIINYLLIIFERSTSEGDPDAKRLVKRQLAELPKRFPACAALQGPDQRRKVWLLAHAEWAYPAVAKSMRGLKAVKNKAKQKLSGMKRRVIHALGRDKRP